MQTIQQQEPCFAGRKKRPKKYISGDPIVSISQVTTAALKGEWIMMRGVPKHPCVIMSMTLRTVFGFIRSGLLHIAEINPSWTTVAQK